MSVSPEKRNRAKERVKFHSTHHLEANSSFGMLPFSQKNHRVVEDNVKRRIGVIY